MRINVIEQRGIEGMHSEDRAFGPHMKFLLTVLTTALPLVAREARADSHSW